MRELLLRPQLIGHLVVFYYQLDNVMLTLD